MPLVRIGSCNHCGKCCLREGGLMVENPMIELGEDRCKFYTEVEGSERYGHCLVISSWAPIEFARDRNGNRITPEQVKWFNDNCPNYPTVEDIEAGHQLLPECSFSFEVVSNG